MLWNHGFLIVSLSLSELRRVESEAPWHARGRAQELAWRTRGTYPGVGSRASVHSALTLGQGSLRDGAYCQPSPERAVSFTALRDGRGECAFRLF